MIDVLSEQLAWPVRIGVNPLYFLTDYSDTYIWLCRVIFVLGMLLRERSFLSLGLGVVISCLLLDPLAVMLLHMLPFSLWLYERGKDSTWLTGAAIVIWSVTSVPLTVFGLLLFLLHSRSRTQSGITIFVGGLLAILCTDPVSFAGYSSLAGLAPISPIHSWKAPLVSPELEGRLVDYATFAELLSVYRQAYLVAAITVLLPVILYFRRGVALPRATLIGYFAALFFLSLSPHLSWQISGLFYGLSLVPLPWIVATAMLLAGVLSERAGAFQLLLTAVIALLLPASQTYTRASESFFSNRVAGYYPEIKWGEPGEEFRPKRLKFRSSYKEGRRYALDGSVTTRWTTNSPQQGGEWVELEFPEPTSCPYLKLSPGKFTADYPRGFRVEADGRRPLEFRNWQGPVRYNDRGLAWFGAQSEVYFPLGSEPVSSVRITQTGSDPYYYWSIAQISCFKER